MKIRILGGISYTFNRTGVGAVIYLAYIYKIYFFLTILIEGIENISTCCVFCRVIEIIVKKLII